MSDEPLARVGKGDPITASWANAVADAINARGAAFPDANGWSTPYGLMLPAADETEMRAPQPLPPPFAVRLIDDADEGEFHAQVYVPESPEDAEVVFLGEAPCVPDLSAASIGGWHDLGEVSADGNARYVVLGFKSDAHARPTYDIRLQTSRRVAPQGCCPGLPVVPLARVCIPTPAASGEVYDPDTGEPTATPEQMRALSSDGGALGLVQYRAGALYIPDQGRRSLDCVIAWIASGGAETQHVVFRLSGAEAVRINGVAVVFDTSAMTALPGWTGWYDLGAARNGSAAWLVLDIPSGADYAAMTNAGPPDARASVVLSSVSAPPTPANIGNRPRLAPPIMIWRSVGSWFDTEPTGEQIVRSSVDLPLAVPDSRNVRADGKLFASVDWGDKGQTQLRGFEGGSPTKTGAQVADASGASLPVRFPRSDGGAEVDYLAAANVAINDGGDLLFNGARYAPTSITINGVAYTLLVKQ